MPQLEEDALTAACTAVEAYDAPRKDMVRRAVEAYKLAEKYSEVEDLVYALRKISRLISNLKYPKDEDGMFVIFQEVEDALAPYNQTGVAHGSGAKSGGSTGNGS